MKSVLLPLPSFMFVIATRAALAAGIGLLVSSRVPAGRRRAVGATLVGIGAATTIPAAIALVRGMRRSRQAASGVYRDKRLIGATRYPRKGDDDL
jgi:hypothetical protein